MRALIPEPMLLVGTFQALEPTIFNSEAVAILEESFCGGHRLLIVGMGAAHGDPIPCSEVVGGAAEELDGVLTKPLIAVEADDRRPSPVPSGTQASAVGLTGVAETEEIDVFTEAQFVLEILA